MNHGAPRFISPAPAAAQAAKPPTTKVTYVCQNAGCDYTLVRPGRLHPADVPICHGRRMTPGAVELDWS